MTLLVVCLDARHAAVGGSRRGPGSRSLGLGLDLAARRRTSALALRARPLPATVTSVGLLAQVPLTALLAVPLLGEPITTSYLIGGALVLAGIYVVSSKN